MSPRSDAYTAYSAYLSSRSDAACRLPGMSDKFIIACPASLPSRSDGTRRRSGIFIITLRRTTSPLSPRLCLVAVADLSSPIRQTWWNRQAVTYKIRGKFRNCHLVGSKDTGGCGLHPRGCLCWPGAAVFRLALRFDINVSKYKKLSSL